MENTPATAAANAYDLILTHEFGDADFAITRILFQLVPSALEEGSRGSGQTAGVRDHHEDVVETHHTLMGWKKYKLVE